MHWRVQTCLLGSSWPQEEPTSGTPESSLGINFIPPPWQDWFFLVSVDKAGRPLKVPMFPCYSSNQRERPVRSALTSWGDRPAQWGKRKATWSFIMTPRRERALGVCVDLNQGLFGSRAKGWPWIQRVEAERLCLPVPLRDTETQTKHKVTCENKI
jgi:hypothetical protein